MLEKLASRAKKAGITNMVVLKGQPIWLTSKANMVGLIDQYGWPQKANMVGHKDHYSWSQWPIWLATNPDMVESKGQYG